MTTRLALAEASASAQNTFTSAVSLHGHYNVSVSGTFTATVTLQRSFDDGTTWLDVKTYTAGAQEVGLEPEYGVVYRIGVKTGEYTSGTAVLRLSR